MSTIGVDLPDDLLEFVTSRVERGEFRQRERVYCCVLSRQRNKTSGIEAALMHGLESGPADEWTAQEWSQIKQHVTERHPKG